MDFEIKQVGTIDEDGIGMITIIANADEAPVGRIKMAVTDDFADIHDVYVEQKYRQQGIANAMMAELFKLLAENAVKEITLEVRESNLAATHLYEKYDFKTVHVRKKYYEDGENALLMRAEVSSDE